MADTATLAPDEQLQTDVVQPAVQREQFALNHPPVDKLDNTKVYATAAHADVMNPVDTRAFAQTVYAQRFGLDPTTSLEEMTQMVHGEVRTPEAAAQQIAKWYEPFAQGDQSEGAKRITDLQNGFTPAQVKFLRLATVQPLDKAVDGLQANISPDQWPHALALMKEYAGTTGGTAGENIVEGVSRSLMQRAAGLQDVRARMDAEVNQFLTPPEQRAPVTPQTPAQFERAKLEYQTRQAQQPVIKSTGNKTTDFVSTILSMLPDLAGGVLAGVGTGGEGSMTYFSTDVLSGFQKHLVYDEGVKPEDAMKISLAASIPYSLALSIKADKLIEPVFGKEVIDGFAKTWLENLPKGWMQKTAEGGLHLGTSWASGVTMATAQDATLEAAQKVVNTLKAGADKNDPGWQHVIDSIIPNAITMAGAVAVTHSVGAGLRGLKGNPIDNTNVEPGEPGKYSDQEAALQKAGVTDAHKPGITQSVVDSYFTKVPGLKMEDVLKTDHGYSPDAAKQITEQLQHLSTIAPERTAIANERIAAARQENEASKQTELDALAKEPSPALPAEKGEAPVEFHSVFPSLVGKPPVEQYRVMGDMEGASKTDTLTRQGIEKLGYSIPEAEAEKARQAAIPKPAEEQVAPAAASATLGKERLNGVDAAKVRDALIKKGNIGEVNQWLTEAIADNPERGAHYQEIADEAKAAIMEKRGGASLTGEANPVEEGVQKVKEAVESTPKEAKRSKAVTDAAYLLLRGADIGKVKPDVEVDATRIFNKLSDFSDLPPADLMRKVRETEINQRYDDRLHTAVSGIYHDAVIEGADDKEADLRRQAADRVRDMLGQNELKPEDDVPTLEKSLRAAVMYGKAIGVDKGKPAETVMMQALDTKERKNGLTSKATREQSYKTDLARVQQAQDMLAAGKGDAARKVLDDIFGKEDAHRISRAAYGAIQAGGDAGRVINGLFDKLQDVLQGRLAATYADDTIRAFRTLKDGRNDLTDDARAQFDALAKRSGFPLDQLGQMKAAENKLQMYRELAAEGRITPDELQQREDAAGGYRKGLAEFFREMPFDDLQDLHDNVRQIIADSNREKYAIQAGKVVEREQRNKDIAAEVKATKEAVYGQGDKAKGAIGWNRDTGLFGLQLGNGRDDSKVYDTLFTGVDGGERTAQAMRGRLTDVLNDKLAEHGFTPLDKIKWGHDRQVTDIAGGKLILTTADAMDIYNSLKDPKTIVELGKTKGLKSIIDKYRSYGVKFGDAENAERQLRTVVDARLTPAQKDVADTMQKALQDPDLVKALNDVSRWDHGTSDFNNPDYWPVSRDISGKQTGRSIDDLRGAFTTQLQNLGLTKSRQSNVNEILYQNAFDKFDRHLDQTTKIAHLAIPLSEAQDVLASRESGQAILDRFGQRPIADQLDTYQRVAGLWHPDTSALTGLLNWMKKGILTGTLWGRVTTFLKVRGGTMAMGGAQAAAEYGPQAAVNIASRFGPPIPQGGRAVENLFLLPEYAKARDELLQDGYFDNRWLRRSTDVFSQVFNAGPEGVNTPDVIANNAKLAEMFGIAKHYSGAIEKWGMNPYSAADMRSAVSIYLGLQDSGLDKQTALDKTVQYVRQSQPPSSALDMTKGYKTVQSPGVWLVAPFLGTPSRAANLLQREITKLQAGQPGAIKRLAITGVGVATQVAISALVSRAAYAITTGKPFNPFSDEDQKGPEQEIVHDTAFLLDHIEPGTGALLDRGYQLATRGDMGNESAVQKTINDLGHGGLVITKALQNGTYDADDPQIKKALVQLSISAGMLARVPIGGPVADLKLLEGLTKRDE